MAVPKNTTLIINACGLVNSKRNKSDGCTIIGSQEPTSSGEVFNDFVISQLDTGIGKRHMVIKYNMDNKSYYLRDLGDGSGTFVRLDIPLVSPSPLTKARSSSTAISYPSATLTWWSSSSKRQGCRAPQGSQERGPRRCS